MMQGIAAYKLSDAKYLVFIDDEVWKIDAEGWAEFVGSQLELGSFEVNGERVDGLRYLPRPVLEVIAGRCEAIDYSPQV